MKNRKLIYCAAAAALYFLLLFLLVMVEKGGPDASITGIGSAIWYSLTTLTTVGYGDMYPVTIPGRLIGALFQILSIGVLVALISAMFSLIRGRLLPLAYLRFRRRSHWFIFAQTGQRSRLIAEAVASEDKDAVILFSSQEGDQEIFSAGTCIALPPDQLVDYQKGKGKCTVFALSDDQTENDLLADQLKNKACRVCAMTEYEPDRLSENLILFDPFRICARLYWARYPLTSPSEVIVISGSGRYAEALLEQALIFNVIAPDQHISYHVIGDFENFRRNHPYLDQAFSVCDQIEFHEGPWNRDFDILKKADRIIFCHDDPRSSMEEVTQLKRYCPTDAVLYVRGSVPLEGIRAFGSPQVLCRPEYILRSGLYQMAIRLHRIYQDSVKDAPGWEELSGFLRRSNMASADHLLMKVRILLGPWEDEGAEGSLLPSREALQRAARAYRALDQEGLDRCRRIEHERWMRFHLMNNWQYAEKRDNARRLHHLLLPYDQLSLPDQLKDNYAWELIEKLC
ncbi:MAG: hypothetical protein II628_01085 [Lachnospiraceae bacterium]|nr:hypothetical protein [Lachnospiraceae bacterium]